ncbi:hypothetical protein ATO11_20770 [Pseudaestuariivita atlantica]|uniref:Uncharacterized protein n=1 Tax=Pseudaestuariivita atlantica TaxID=1317121 RepID=A0A0L1JJ62_9RHOB|nr:hypothetical protein ATO11_20770 [Pseudaestuariivita atlantica]
MGDVEGIARLSVAHINLRHGGAVYVENRNVKGVGLLGRERAQASLGLLEMMRKQGAWIITKRCR